MKEMGYDQSVQLVAKLLKTFFGYSELLLVNDTFQFDDYSKYAASRYDPIEKARRREEVFPKDCAKAYDMGARFAAGQSIEKTGQ